MIFVYASTYSFSVSSLAGLAMDYRSTPNTREMTRCAGMTTRISFTFSGVHPVGCCSLLALGLYALFSRLSCRPVRREVVPLRLAAGIAVISSPVQVASTSTIAASVPKNETRPSINRENRLKAAQESNG